MRDPCSLYVISGEFKFPSCKVGISATPEKRLAQLQTGSPALLVISRQWNFASRETAKQIESDLHSIFSEMRMSGEWFGTYPEYVSAAVVGLFRNCPHIGTPEYIQTVENLQNFVGENIDRLACSPEHF